MRPFIIRPNLSESTFAKNIALCGVVDVTEIRSIVGHIYWQWDDEPEMEPEYLGEVAAGHNLRVPFDPKGRDVRLYLVSQSGDGLRSVQRIAEAVQTVFSAPARAYSGEIVMEAGEDLDENDLINIYDDGGTPKARKADATDPTKPAVAFVIESAGASLVSGQPIRLFFGGNIIPSPTSITIGAVQYLSDTTPGRHTETPPAGSGEIIQVIGRAVNANEIIFEPDEPFLIP